MKNTPTTTIAAATLPMSSLVFTLFLTVTFLAASLYMVFAGLVVPAMTVASAG